LLLGLLGLLSGAVITSGTGALAFGYNKFTNNIAVVGGALSIVDGNETNDTPLYIQGNTFGEERGRVSSYNRGHVQVLCRVNDDGGSFDSDMSVQV